MSKKYPELDEMMKEVGLPGSFLARRLYKAMGFETVYTAAGFIDYLRRLGFRRGETVRSEEELRRAHAVLLYAVGAPKDHPDVVELVKKGVKYPPRKGVSYRRLLKIQTAMREPKEADPELLKELEPDEKLRVLDAQGIGEVDSLMDRMIEEGKVREYTGAGRRKAE